MFNNKNIIKLFLLICIIGVIFSSYKIITWKLNVSTNEKIKDTIDKSIKVNNKDDIKIDFKELKKTNPDTIAYIKVNNTNIDYIVVKGTDNSYYLKHNFEKNYNIAGWIFLDYRNKLDGNDKNIIIYGHDTKDGSMFGTLKNILDKEWYTNSKNKDILFITEKGINHYQVFSTYTIDVEDYYLKTDFNNDKEFKSFIDKITSRSNYNYKVSVNSKDSILTLSSCINDGRRRVVLHAKKIQ